ncbi:MAG: zinc ABC transporter substrate-binding protein [Kiritimatiellaeota bacterium]|nr:zinc ABC transporter substrate-binding protein [Kiritimatiellota bacterium]
MRLLVVIAFCLISSAFAHAQKPIVFVSIPPQLWLAKRIAGDAVEIQTLLPAGASPHTFEPTAKQITKLADASLALTLGLEFERSLVARAQKLNAKLVVAPVDAGIEKLGAHAHHNHALGGGCTCGGTDGDPHIWLSPRGYAAMASNTTAALVHLLPKDSETFAARRDTVVGEIQTIGAEMKGLLEQVPVKTFVVYHPSWTYFAEDYGLTLLTIEQDGKAPSAKHLAALIADAKAGNVKVVISEPQYNKRPAQTVAKQIGARVEILNALQEDWPALMREAAAVFR